MDERVIKIDRFTDAIVDVDAQTTFMPGGGLAVTGGDEIVPVVLDLHRLFDLRYATLDQHPYGHISLASSYIGLEPYTALTLDTVAGWTNKDRRIADHALFTLDDLKNYLTAAQVQVLWPDHAIEGTAEAELHPDLSMENYRFVQVKGLDPKCDSYSGFLDNLRRPTGLADRIRQDGVRRLFITGLAYDFCVGWTAIDAKAEGFEEVFVIKNASRAVNMLGTILQIETDFVKAGVSVIDSSQLKAV